MCPLFYFFLNGYAIHICIYCYSVPMENMCSSVLFFPVIVNDFAIPKLGYLMATSFSCVENFPAANSPLFCFQIDSSDEE